jgi:hypothetical protein
LALNIPGNNKGLSKRRGCGAALVLFLLFFVDFVFDVHDMKRRKEERE